MSLFFKKYTIKFSLQTKDNKQFRYVYVDFEQKRNWYWFTKENKDLEKCLMTYIQKWFLNRVNRAWIFEKLRLYNFYINRCWNLEYQPTLKTGKIRNIKITNLIP